MLLRGRWDLADKGVMDRTHLRWFTPRSFARMFEETGYAVDRLAPLSPLGAKARVLSALLGGRFEHLFWYQINLHGHAA